MTSPRLFAFGPYRLDVHERQLLREDRPVSLPPKLFDLLATLVQSAGHLIQKEDLLDAVWGEVAVEEGSLTRAVSSLRQLLGPSRDGEEYLQTVAKRGYRFTASVRETIVDDHEGPHAPSRGPLPPQLSASPTVEFVGRERELREMVDVWQRALRGAPSVAPSWPVSRASARHACQSSSLGGRDADAVAILMGCSDEEALVPYQPFVEALTWYVRSSDTTDLRKQLAAAGGGAELAALIPELRRRIPDLDTHAGDESGSAAISAVRRRDCPAVRGVAPLADPDSSSTISTGRTRPRCCSCAM